MKSETIAAIATAMSQSGIGIIRMSGEDAICIADGLYCSKSGKKKLISVPTHTIHYGYIKEKEEILDEVLISVMRSPNSYTGEDVVEINCHGGIVVMNRILQAVIKNGARIAEPGEFTKRAFLNGKIDLSRAEAVMDLIHAQNELAQKTSVNQLRGSLSKEIKIMREELIYEIAFIESALDDPEHISTEGYGEKLSMKLKKTVINLEKLLSTADNGKLIKEGIRVVIVGKPNAGKSSFLNLLAGEERAIVTEIAGTTRDILEETIMLNGITLHIIDTAGIRSTDDVVEKIGVERARKYASDADLILYILDGSVPLDENDEEIMNLIQNKKFIILINKSDLYLQSESSLLVRESIQRELEKREWISEETYRILSVSAKENKGMAELEELITEMFFKKELTYNDEIMITNQRHKEALSQALLSLRLVQKSIEDEMPEDFLSIDLMSAYSYLGAIIGEEVGEDLVNEIFSKFCMGK